MMNMHYSLIINGAALSDQISTQSMNLLSELW